MSNISSSININNTHHNITIKAFLPNSKSNSFMIIIKMLILAQMRRDKMTESSIEGNCLLNNGRLLLRMELRCRFGMNFPIIKEMGFIKALHLV